MKTTRSKPCEVGFIGAGRMAGAMVSGLIQKEVFPTDSLACTCGDDDTGPHLADRTGIHYIPDALDLVRGCDTVVLACKPQQFADLDPLVGSAAAGSLILSILAGIPIARLETRFPRGRCLVRTMPNTPGQIGCGITGWASRLPPSPEDRTRLESILGALGKVVPVSESELDAVTAVSGSGPAYVFEFTAALEEAAHAAGLDPESARILARQTVIGSARLLESDPATPESLRDRVTSPGGTTEAALRVFNEHQFRSILKAAVLRAKARSIELAQS